MNEQRFEELLRSADEDLSMATPAALAAAVRRRARRRAVLRLAGPAAAAALALAVALGHLVLPGKQIAHDMPANPGWPQTVPSSLPAPTVDVQRLRAEYARLGREADFHTKLAATMLRAQDLAARRARAARVLAEPDAGQVVAAQMDRAARTLVDFGDDLLRRQPQVDQSVRAMAAGAYRDAAALSPDSSAAAVARQRLQEMNI